MNAQKNAYRLLVLTDLSEASERALRNAAQLAKVINGSVEALHVISIALVVDQENQVMAMRKLHKKYRKTKAMVREMVEKIAKTEDVSISTKIDYGNVKDIMLDYIKTAEPDIVVLGRRKSKVVDFIGDGITSYIIDNCQSNILISGDTQQFHSFSELSLGVYGKEIAAEGFEIIDHLHQKTNQPMRFFSIGEKEEATKGTEQESNNAQDRVSYVFVKGANALEGLANYVKHSDTRLFCIPRLSKSKSIWRKKEAVNVNTMVRLLDIPVLIVNN
ncbi:universal stress protein [Sungkyunkwania multivorans]|uniref:Universal stress protein n=1 Tax=Sungkyunkwania multivorans TaxID=1173618 RepID=A0ABW3CWD7_9FLAO